MNRSIFAVAVAALVSAANAQTFNFSGTGAIPDNNPAGLTMTTGPVSGMFSNIFTVGVSLTFDPGHSFAGDLICTLTYDAGSDSTIDGTIFVFNRIGRITTGFGESSDLLGSYFFVDGGADIWAAGGTVGAAVAIPDINSNSYAPTGADSATALSFSAVFGGMSSSGTWTLNISDNAGQDTGTITAASIQLSTIPTPGAAALIGLGGLTLSRRRR